MGLEHLLRLAPTHDSVIPSATHNKFVFTFTVKSLLLVLERERGVHLNALGEVHAGGEEQQGLPLDRGLTVEAPGNARAEIFLKTYKIEISFSNQM